MVCVFVCFSHVSLKVELDEMSELSDMRENVLNQVVGAMKEAQEYRDVLYKYAYLWQDDRDDFMEQFLLYGKVLSPEEIEAHGEDSVPKNPPTLKDFKEEVQKEVPGCIPNDTLFP
jgi:dynein heavy chain